jgi:hypothetical protein
VAQRAWWLGPELASSARPRVRQGLAIPGSLEPLLVEVEDKLARHRSVGPWASLAASPVQLPVSGILSAMVVCATVGAITR